MRGCFRPGCRPPGRLQEVEGDPRGGERGRSAAGVRVKGEGPGLAALVHVLPLALIEWSMEFVDGHTATQRVVQQGFTSDFVNLRYGMVPLVLLQEPRDARSCGLIR